MSTETKTSTWSEFYEIGRECNLAASTAFTVSEALFGDNDERKSMMASTLLNHVSKPLGALERRIEQLSLVTGPEAIATSDATAATEPAAEQLMEAVGDQRMKLLDVLNLTEVLTAASATDTSGLFYMNGALRILQEAIQGVVEGLEPIMLDRAIEAAREAS